MEFQTTGNPLPTNFNVDPTNRLISVFSDLKSKKKLPSNSAPVYIKFMSELFKPIHYNLPQFILSSVPAQILQMP